MTKKNNEKRNTKQSVTFVHSLFRSGSTYVYNALKRTGNFHVYHEPMHEVIASLPDSWDELAGRKDQLKGALRHDFLVGGYFDEYAHLLPSIRKAFNTKLSFDFYFMAAGDQVPELKAYIDLLIDGAPKTPVLQCTRTSGRIGWLKENYESKHVFLLRNPWDQWYSYKVDPYIATTPRVIYSQNNIPAVLKEVLNASGVSTVLGDDTRAKIVYGFNYPIPPIADYFLFFGLWLHAFISGKQGCDVFMDMDALSSSEAYRKNSLARLEDIGLKFIDLSDMNLHRAVFSAREQATYRIVEEQVLKIFRQHEFDTEILNEVHEYLQKARDVTFVSDQVQIELAPGILEDASRMRETLLAHGQQGAKLTASLNQAVAEREGQIVNLNQAVAERDGQIVNFNQAVTERDGQIVNLNQAVAERDGQIVNFNQAVTERDGQIVNLNQAVTEREGQIVNLNQAVAERDGQIVNLNQAVTECEGQINSLNQTMSEREGQINSLTNETVRRGEWALGLKAELQTLTQSHSWRLTRPLREVRSWFSHPAMQAERYGRAIILAAKKNHHRIPLSYTTKRWIYRNIGMRFLPIFGRDAGSLTVFRGDHRPDDPLLLENSLTQLLDGDGFSNTARQRPEMSVIIPIYGNILYTLRCLLSIRDNPPKVHYELIIVDDASPDQSLNILKNINGLRLVTNTENIGFIRSCNAGAKVALGDYLLFLNNDTEVTPGWMDELHRTFHEFPGTGLAGSKLLYPDGRLQEAGGIIWQDGSAWNFGRFQNSLLPIYNYAREVDYCSGASITVPKTLFEELGGFDEYYLPAYCEDSDLALKIRDRGYRVIYQPLSTVIHYEGITSGTDISQGVKAYQVENSKKLFLRWKDRLKGHQSPGVDVDKAKDRRATRCVLVLDNCTPTPDQDSGSVTTFNLMLLLREMGFQVTFIPVDNFLYMPEYTTALQRVGVEVLYAPYVTSVKEHLKESGGRYDLALLFRPDVIACHLEAVRRYSPKAKVIYHTVDLHFLRMSREAELLSDKSKQKAADEMKQLELTAIRAVDAAIVHSTVELEILAQLLPDVKPHLFSLIVDIKGTHKPFSERRDIVFVGGYQHPPNVDAVKYFVAEIMPLLRQRLPGICFYAVGSKTPAEIQALASEDVIILGFINDLAPLLDKMRVSVAPLRYGAGVKGKIAAAMAAGLPVVATSLAAEGMLLSDGQNILVADGAEAFVETIAKIYRDEVLWNRISQNGLAFAEQAWGAEAAWGILVKILSDLGISVKRGAHPLSLYSGCKSSESETNSANRLSLQPIASVKRKKDFEQILKNDSIQKIRPS